MEEKQSFGLSGSALKVIAIAAMTVDHIAWTFVPTMTPLGQAMHVIGRLTAPIMCFLIAEGYLHTRSVRVYALRLAGFAVLSQAPYSLLFDGKLFDLPLNVMYTLCLGLLAILIFDKAASPAARAVGIVCAILLAAIGDWGCYGAIFCLVFYIFHKRPLYRNIGITLAVVCMVAEMTANNMTRGMGLYNAVIPNLMQLGVILSLPLISRYSGKRGRNLPGGRWFFYAYYPAHLLILYAIKVGWRWTPWL